MKILAENKATMVVLAYVYLGVCTKCAGVRIVVTLRKFIYCGCGSSEWSIILYWNLWECANGNRNSREFNGCNVYECIRLKVFCCRMKLAVNTGRYLTLRLHHNSLPFTLLSHHQSFCVRQFLFTKPKKENRIELWIYFN